MRRSTERFLTTHVGSLVRPPEIADAIRAGGAPDMDARVSRAVRDVVRKQAEIGIDVLSDGEYSKPNFASYVNERLSGFELRKEAPIQAIAPSRGRDSKAFAALYYGYDRADRVHQASPTP